MDDSRQGRSLGVAGLFNARDAGGLPAAGGRSVVAGRLFRSEVITAPGTGPLHSIWLPEQMAALRDLGVRTIVDLRGSAEVAGAPSVWRDATGAHSVEHLPIEDGGAGAEKDFVEMLRSGRIAQFGADEMGKHYVEVLDAHVATFASVVSIVAWDAPALIHCSEGKDRTGLATALILAAIGVDRAAILADYRLTGELRPDRARAYEPQFAAVGIDHARFRVMYETPESAMAIALDHLEAQPGGVVGYLTRGGVDGDTLDELRRTLLTSTSA